MPARLKLSSTENRDTVETNGYRRGERDKSPLATLDVFAGCGGLSEGLQRAGNLLYYNIFHKSRNIVYVSLVEGREGLWEASGSIPYWYIYIYVVGLYLKSLSF